MTITVTPVDDAPTIAPIASPQSKDGESVTLNLSSYVTNVDGDSLTYAASGLPPGLAIDATTGRITGVLPSNASNGGPYAVTVTVSDGNGNVTTRSFTWTVNNPPPIARDDVATGQINQAITVKVLGNDNDPDNDGALTITGASAGRGAVAILADGSIRYTPPTNYSGTDTITYVVSDGNGGFATAAVTINVVGDTFVEKRVVFGFNSNTQTDEINTPAPYDYEGVSVDGAVLAAVFDIQSLNSLADQLTTEGVVVTAANGVASLNGIGSIGVSGIVLDAVSTERAREIAFRAGFDRNFQDYRLEGLPGFSMRNNVPGNLGGLSTREQLIVESLVREQTLMLQFSNTLQLGDRRIVEYRITQHDGSPLPAWLDRVAPDLLIGRRDVNAEEIVLKVEAVYSDGASVTREFKVNTATGEIQPVKQARQGEAPPQMFQDQFRAKPNLTGDQVQELGRALAR